MNLSEYGYTGGYEKEKEEYLIGRVTEQQRNMYTVITNKGEVDAVLMGSFVHGAEIRADLPYVGDFVLLKYNDSGASRISELLPRRSKFSRSDSFGHSFAHIKANKEQIVAANFDYVFILTSLNRDFRVSRILRYLSQAKESGGELVVILTKADLIDDCSKQINEVRAAAPDVSVHAVSSHTGYGLEALNPYFRPGKTVVFLGMSGVGKSSLLNALADEELMLVNETRKVDESKGRHTTTHRQLFVLPTGAMVIDTPGMRELGLFDAEEGISSVFSEVEALFPNCRFSNCRHKGEPGCAVAAAIKEGSITQELWDGYQKQQRGNQYMDNKADYRREGAKMYRSMVKAERARSKATRAQEVKR